MSRISIGGLREDITTLIHVPRADNTRSNAHTVRTCHSDQWTIRANGHPSLRSSDAKQPDDHVRADSVLHVACQEAAQSPSDGVIQSWSTAVRGDSTVQTLSPDDESRLVSALFSETDSAGHPSEPVIDFWTWIASIEHDDQRVSVPRMKGCERPTSSALLDRTNNSRAGSTKSSIGSSRVSKPRSRIPGNLLHGLDLDNILDKPGARRSTRERRSR
jgi:hypothetical protein